MLALRIGGILWSLALLLTPLPSWGKNMETAQRERAEVGPWLARGVSREAYEAFQEFWLWFENTARRGQITIPSKVIWLNGAPGAGKGTNTGYIQAVFAITAPPLITSDLLSSPEFEKRKNSGQLVGDRDVTRLVLGNLLTKRHANGVVVDGYPRTTVQAECVKLFHDKIVELRRQSEFRVVVLEVSEAVSVERQLGRGLRAQRNNERVAQTGQGQPLPLRSTDLTAEAAKGRYQVFVRQTNDALAILQKHFPCYRISAEGSFDAVRQEIYQIFAQEK
jgi:adenylate kinase